MLAASDFHWTLIVYADVPRNEEKIYGDRSARYLLLQHYSSFNHWNISFKTAETIRTSTVCVSGTHLPNGLYVKTHCPRKFVLHRIPYRLLQRWKKVDTRMHYSKAKMMLKIRLANRYIQTNNSQLQLVNHTDCTNLHAPQTQRKRDHRSNWRRSTSVIRSELQCHHLPKPNDLRLQVVP